MVVQLCDCVVDAVGKVLYGFSLDLAVGYEGVVAKVVCADPNGVDGVFGLASEELGAVGGAVG